MLILLLKSKFFFSNFELKWLKKNGHFSQNCYFQYVIVYISNTKWCFTLQKTKPPNSEITKFDKPVTKTRLQLSAMSARSRWKSPLRYTFSFTQAWDLLTLWSCTIQHERSTHTLLFLTNKTKIGVNGEHRSEGKNGVLRKLNTL